MTLLLVKAHGGSDAFGVGSRPASLRSAGWAQRRRRAVALTTTVRPSPETNRVSKASEGGSGLRQRRRGFALDTAQDASARGLVMRRAADLSPGGRKDRGYGRAGVSGCAHKATTGSPRSPSLRFPAWFG